jgi:hypothetical protein
MGPADAGCFRRAANGVELQLASRARLASLT